MGKNTAAEVFYGKSEVKKAGNYDVFHLAE
jgi:hypothetical protein